MQLDKYSCSKVTVWVFALVRFQLQDNDSNIIVIIIIILLSWKKSRQHYA